MPGVTWSTIAVRAAPCTIISPLLALGYYADPSLLTAGGGPVSELLGGATNLRTWTFTGNINHFSGYMISCGRSGSSLSSEE